ncbi:hypothetical protein LCGC14_0629760 [marine sediment metagenome]|uniref:Nucleotidyltransferase n=1 Tax=marine sediment metagenome TaxID=412755 RepID=A0A0F9R259_9ZZZZ
MKRQPKEGEILRCIVGSRAYGLATETSDTDLKAIYISPKEEVIGVSQEDKTRPFGPDDHSYSLRHFARLAVKCVPNVLELLFCEKEDIISQTVEGNILRQYRNDFLSKNCIAPYIGYAEGQLKKAAKVPTNRGLGRQKIVEEFGFDCKFAMHTIRLLQTAKELLDTGILNVRRPNREFLLDIRYGRAFNGYDEFRKFALNLVKEVRELENKTSLPEKPDIEKINWLIVYLHELYWGKT